MRRTLPLPTERQNPGARFRKSWVCGNPVCGPAPYQGNSGAGTSGSVFLLCPSQPRTAAFPLSGLADLKDTLLLPLALGCWVLRGETRDPSFAKEQLCGLCRICLSLSPSPSLFFSLLPSLPPSPTSCHHVYVKAKAIVYLKGAICLMPLEFIRWSAFHFQIHSSPWL